MFSNPEKNLKVFGLKEDSIVADLGAGTGFWAVAAGKLAPRGKIYAVEIDKDYLGTIKHKVADAGLKNVEIIWGNCEKPGGTKIGTGVADAGIASSILFQTDDREGFAREAGRILKKGGRILVSDWEKNSVMGRVAFAKERARELFERAGFAFEREFDAGAEHYGMILRKQ